MKVSKQTVALVAVAVLVSLVVAYYLGYDGKIKKVEEITGQHRLNRISEANRHFALAAYQVAAMTAYHVLQETDFSELGFRCFNDVGLEWHKPHLEKMRWSENLTIFAYPGHPKDMREDIGGRVVLNALVKRVDRCSKFGSSSQAYAFGYEETPGKELLALQKAAFKLVQHIGWKHEDGTIDRVETHPGYDRSRFFSALGEVRCMLSLEAKKRLDADLQRLGLSNLLWFIYNRPSRG